ncbi:MAG: ExeM/NucH family extracellular endonuclease [Alkalimonas sp.]|nr:ExeM/NucH family extracellular endonuclease [Alkalimonas sp.]
MKQLLALVLLVCTFGLWAQTPIAYWSQNFNELPDGNFGFNPESFPQQPDSGAGALFLTNFNEDTTANGSYVSIQSFAGTTINALPGYAAGGSLSVQGGPGNSNNGAAVVIQVNSEGYQDLQLSWAQRGTATGFNERRISWSLDGETFTEFAVDAGALGSSFQLRSYDFSAVDELNNQASVYFRITLDGASNATGNNRFDNLLVTGNLSADADRITLYQRDFASNPFEKGWQQWSLQGEQQWQWDGGFNNVSFSGFVDGSCNANDSWLVSPAFELDSQTGERLAVDIARGFAGVNNLDIYYSTQFNGTELEPSDWELLTSISPDDFSSNNVPVRFDGFEQLAALNGKVHLALRYQFDSGNCSTWRLANILLTAENPIEPAAFACDNPVTRIHQVQGTGFQSPLQGAEVQLQAVVTAAFQQTDNGGLGGFYLQEKEQNQDNNPATSEGIFVYDNGFGVPVQVGDLVRVRGTVAEFFEETQLADVNELAICDSDRLQQVSPVELNLPVDSFEQLESIAGMWVQTADDFTVTDVFNAVRFGEFTVSNGRLYNPTQIVTPGTEAQAVMASNRLNRMIIDNGLTGVNRQPFITGEDGVSELSASNPIRNGYLVRAGLDGVMSYAFGAYRMRQLSTPSFITSSNPRTETPVLAEQGDLNVATFNVENLFTTFDVPGNSCGPNELGCRGARSESELIRQLDKLIPAILALDADVLALIEIENDADDSTLQHLVTALNDASSTADWNYVATGWLGTDAIKPAFIYRANRVSLHGGFAVLDSSVDPDFDTSRQRPALAQSFITEQGAVFTAVAVHLRAKVCGNASGINADQGDGQGCWNNWRTKSAEAMLRWLETDPTHAGNSDIMVLGDFNAYAKEDPLAAMEAAGFVNLAVQSNAGDYSVYSYTFMGESGSLDHAFASPSLAAKVLQAQSWYINSDEIPAFNYSEGPLQGGLVKPDNFYEADPFRTSDHDPLLITLQLNAVQPPLNASLELIRVNQARSGVTLVQLRWSSEQTGLTLYRDDSPVTTLNRPGRYNDRFRASTSDVIYTLCDDTTALCSEPLAVQF